MPEECKDSDLILVCLKTTANDYMLKTLPKLIGPNSVVMTLQNGLGNEEEISKVISADKIIGGVAFICVNRISAGKIDHSAFGHVKANGFNKNFAPEKLRAVKELFEQSGLDFSIEENLHELKWEKLVWNVPFNGLSASLGGVDTRSILAHQPTHAVAIELMKEVILGAKTQDVILDNKLIDENINKTLKMGPYMTSMSIDRLNKKPLEVEGIIGIPLRKAKDKGIKLPYMENLYAELSYYNASLIK
ncbi:MAG: 2-dehydropantoate 2-reductase [uncultured bacterium]|nr:MAG: 2-dehydropantoate 2-reductase [uncultured bacterium]